MEYLKAFLCGGILCAIGQILIDKTKLTPARILTGYVVEFSEWVLGLTGIEMTLTVRIIYLIIGVVLMCFASSLYITSSLGVSSYDAQALMIADTGKLQFRFARIGTDLVCVTAGWLLKATIGVGTLVTALFMGPLIDFFNRKIAIPLLNRPVK